MPAIDVAFIIFHFIASDGGGERFFLNSLLSCVRHGEQCVAYIPLTRLPIHSEMQARRFTLLFHRILPGLPAPSVPLYQRDHFSLPNDVFLFLMMLDLGSSMQRKNPLGAIEAYRRAVRPSDKAQLVIKVAHSTLFPKEFAQLSAAAASVNAILLTDQLTEEETNSLSHACDAYLSLHRAEGFGFTLAEAMQRARPVIATGWSGNLDFMSASNSYLVNSHLISVGSTCNIYSQMPESMWADPDLNHAAHYIRHVLDEREESSHRGEIGRDEVCQLMSVKQSAAELHAHLQRIRQESLQLCHRTV